MDKKIEGTFFIDEEGGITFTVTDPETGKSKSIIFDSLTQVAENVNEYIRDCL